MAESKKSKSNNANDPMPLTPADQRSESPHTWPGFAATVWRSITAKGPALAISIVFVLIMCAISFAVFSVMIQPQDSLNKASLCDRKPN